MSEEEKARRVLAHIGFYPMRVGRGKKKRREEKNKKIVELILRRRTPYKNSVLSSCSCVCVCVCVCDGEQNED
jgi:hypothetical protein